MKEMKTQSKKAASFLKGLANADRLLILCCLAEGEASVTDLIEQTGIAQTSMSQHLSKLKEENIVDSRREHRTLYYSIVEGGALDIMQILHAMFCQKGKKK